MTDIYLHGILAQEYGKAFRFEIAKPKDALKAIDANREGFIPRILELQREGFLYDIIVDKQRVTHPQELEISSATRIDIVPAIVGSGFISMALSFLASGTILANIVVAIGLAALQFALTPKPDLGMEPEQQLSAEASAMKSSYIFSTHINTASQGTAVPLGYGRLKVGSAVIQSSMKSFPTIKRSSIQLGKDQGNPEGWAPEENVARNFR
jgi:predicted phage tail protein|tara:strand:- start:144 stop:773 length:630 start_codon:yes stop_codon:yes gene_type:complete